MADRAPQFGITLFASFYAFAISLLLTPVMARLFSPAEYGGFAVTNMIATIAAGASQFSLTNALARSRSLVERARLTIALLKLTAIGTVVTVGLAALVAALGKPGQSWTSWWFVVSCPLLMLAIAAYRIVSAWSVSFANFRGQAYARMIYATFGRGIAIAGGAAGLSKAWVMIAAEASAFVLQALFLMRGRANAAARLWQQRGGPVVLSEELKRYKTFTHLDYSSQLLLLLGSAAPVIITGWVHGAKPAGLLSLSISLVNIPVALIALAIAPAMLHRLSGAWRLGDTNSKRRVTQDFLVIAAISIAGYGLLAFIAPTVFPILLGAQWNSAGPLASLLCLPFALSFVVTPFYAILLYSGLASAKLRLDIVLTFAALLALLIPWWNSPRQAIFAWVIVATVHRLADLSLVARSVQMLDRART